MQHIKQHNNHSCVIASIAMLTDGVSYRTIKNYCRKHFKYNVTKKSGCFFKSKSLIGYLESLGHIIQPLEEGFTGTIGELSNYGEAFICLSTDTGGHAIAWDGCRIFDPSHEQPYSERSLYKIYEMDTMNVYLIPIKTPIFKRFVNRIKIWYYNVI